MGKKYFVMHGDRRCGPYTLEELPGAGVEPDTYVWCKGMADWKKAEEVADISRFYRSRILDIMHPATSLPVVAEDNLNEASQEDIDEIPPYSHLIEKSGTEYNRIPEEEPDDSVAPKSCLVESVLVTLFCSLLGVIAIYYAMRCGKAWKAGMKEESREYSRKAKMWTGISFFLGFISAAYFISRML